MDKIDHIRKTTRIAEIWYSNGTAAGMHVTFNGNIYQQSFCLPLHIGGIAIRYCLSIIAFHVIQFYIYYNYLCILTIS